jgi:ATP-dependent protease ClpP protease subunit
MQKGWNLDPAPPEPIPDEAREKIAKAMGELVLHEPDVLKVEGNRIYFYSEINRSNVMELNHRLRQMSSAHISGARIAEMETPAPMFLHIQSFGGSMFAGLSAMDEIRNCPVPVTTIIDGCCASAATLLSIVGATRLMKRNSYVLIHEISSMCWGKISDLRDAMENAELWQSKILELYREYTKIPPEELEELLKHDIWWDAEKCLEYGIIDEIIG